MFKIIYTILTLLILIPTGVFYSFRIPSVNLTLPGILTDNSGCYSTSSCQTSVCVIEYSGYLMVNYTYFGILYSEKVPPNACCGCCLNYIQSRQIVWLDLHHKNPTEVKAFSCNGIYNDHPYYWLYLIFLIYFGLSVIVSVLLWISYGCNKNRSNENIILLN